jgi:hypothetical protein
LRRRIGHGVENRPDHSDLQEEISGYRVRAESGGQRIAVTVPSGGLGILPDEPADATVGAS